MEGKIPKINIFLFRTLWTNDGLNGIIFLRA